MIRWILFSLLALNLCAYELEKEYFYTRDTVYSTDLFPGVKKFELLRIPPGKIVYRVNAQVLAKTFELGGVGVDPGKTRFVSFIKKSPIDLTSLKIQLVRLLQERYPPIAIRAVHIHPRGYIESLPPEASAVLDETFYLNGEGTFYVPDAHGVRRYFDYVIDATLPVLHTSRKAERRENLTAMNAIAKEIPFESFRDVPLFALPDLPHRFRSTLRPGTAITARHIERMPLVRKNDNVVLVVRNGTVVLELIATATQEGSLYDIITVQKRDGKRSRAKVIGEKRVELQ